MMLRRGVHKGKSARAFRKAVSHTRPQNHWVSRGGWRL